MIAWLLLLVLSAAPVVSSEVAAQEPPSGTLKIDILTKSPAQKCDSQTSDEIVVCADKADNESQRLRYIAKAAIYDKDESALEFGISEHVRMSFEAGSAAMAPQVVTTSVKATGSLASRPVHDRHMERRSHELNDKCVHRNQSVQQDQQIRGLKL